MTKKFRIEQIAPQWPLIWAATEWFYWPQEVNDILKRDVDDALFEAAQVGSVPAAYALVAITDPAAAEALSHLQRGGVPIDEFWVVGPSLEEIVQGFFVGEGDR